MHIAHKALLAVFSLGIIIINPIFAKSVNETTSKNVTPIRGETPAQKKGFEIAALSDRSDRGFKDSVVHLTMVLFNTSGDKTTRELIISTLEMPDESIGDKSLVQFLTPKDIQGTALLSYAKILDTDDQWLFLPALKRIKRISSQNKSGPFVGSDFAFEDFTAQELNKFDYEWLREENCGDINCNVIKRIPRYEHSGYAKQLVWIDKTHHQVRKVEFFDRGDVLLKTLLLEKYRNYKGVWRAHFLSMTDNVNGKKTNLIYDKYQFQAGLKDSDFIKNRLSRLR